ITPGITNNPDNIFFAHPSALDKITGRVCYHGELWLKGGPKGYRGKGFSSVLPRLAIALSLMEWSPDFIFGFMYPHSVHNGLPGREGYMHCEPGVWQTSDARTLSEEWLVWMAREDIERLMLFNPEDLFQNLMMGKNGKGKLAANRI
ncbi:MAG: hypothetical protein R3245_10000, partial [Kiloniellales bacterium]|nr:hypothetical protein [Kiloniellales bacterium]